jgi:aspartyl aminopeptidase
MCAVDDISHAVRHFTAFFRNFSALDESLDLDDLPPSQIVGTLDDVPCDHVH